MIEKLFEYIENKGIVYLEDDLSDLNLKGIYFDNVIVLHNQIDTMSEKTCVLAEELGHYETTTGVILDQTNLHNEKQEEKARRWAVDQLIKPSDLIAASNSGVSSRSELSEYLDVTESFIELMLNHFLKVFGVQLAIDEYIVNFDPLWVCKSFD